MSKTLKVILFAIGGFVGLLVLVALGLLLFGDFNTHKPRLEVAASDVLGMQVHIGRLGIGFVPGLHVTLKDVRIQNRGMDVASADETRLAVDLLPLLHAEVRIDSIALIRARIYIEGDRDGLFNFEDPERDERVIPALEWARVSLVDATLLYTDKKSEAAFEVGNCNVVARELRLAEGKSSDFLKNISVAAKMACATMQAKDFVLSDLTFSAIVNGGVFELAPVSMRVFSGQGSGSVQADFSDAVPRYRVQYGLTQFRIEEFLKTLSPQHVAKGLMDFSASLTLRGKTAHEIRKSAAGEISLRGENLTLEGSDLDEELSRYGSSQNLNIVDVGALFFAGPVGLLVTKGYTFASIFTGSEGSTRIRTLVSEWRVEHGVARAHDAAMATNEHRLALKGGIDFANEQFEDVTVALIDAKGCAVMQQKIRGPFQKPVVESPNILVSLAGPAFRLLKKGRSVFTGGECKPFYAGSVAPPTE